MIQNIFYCKSCLNKLEDFGSPAEIAFKSICEAFVLHKQVLIDIQDKDFFQIISFLENKKFILTCDHYDPYVKVKPLGHIYDNEGHFFCINA